MNSPGHESSAISLRFESDIVRRVQNLALGPKTPSNSLVPIYEALYNSIHAVQDRFGDNWIKSGVVSIDIEGIETSDPVFSITDNGIGLNVENFRSFCTYDSGHKVGRGGKGVGRLSWLKVFSCARVQSVFESDGELYERRFKLQLNNERPIFDHTLEPASLDFDRIGTKVILEGMGGEYARHMPTKIDTIVRKVVAHFLPFLVSPSKPSIHIRANDDEFVLSSILGEKEVRLSIQEIIVGDETKLQVAHNLLPRGLIEGQASHKLYVAANDRIVENIDIGRALGIKTYIEVSNQRYVYAGVVSGPLLDEVVNAERTAFDIDAEVMESIKRSAINTIKSALSSQIDRVIGQQVDLTRGVIKKYPRFSYLIENPTEFVRDQIPRSARSAEEIYQQLALYDYRENRDIERKADILSRNQSEPNENAESIESAVSTIIGRLTAQEFSVLADYTVRRKVILDLLEKRMGYKPDGTMRHHSEEALHQFVVPMRVHSGDVHVDTHNLWIVDDKLTYYEHWASDKKIKSLISESTSNHRPDVLLFGGRTAYHRPGTDQPVVIIEFKKPLRNDYSEEENPFVQIYGYIDELRGGRVCDKDGALIQEINDNTPFFCYVIADLTPKLRAWLKMAQINVPLPGGGGFYGYNDEYKAFVQVLSYKYVLRDARLRNEAFFKRLSI